MLERYLQTAAKIMSRSFLDHIAFVTPSGRFVSLDPLLLDVSKLPLDFLHCRFVPRVLSNVVAFPISIELVWEACLWKCLPDLDSLPARCRAQFDDDIQRCRLSPSLGMDEVVGEEGPNTKCRLEAGLFRNLLVFQASFNVERI
jgi:hypothetical protein